MDSQRGPERAGSLVVELAARTVIVDGTRVELPPTEFSLLAVLAARPGEVIPHKELLQEAFGDSAYMSAQDLHWPIWNIRKLIGDTDKTIIRNRRGVGFVLESSQVQVLEGVAEAPATATVHLEPQETPPLLSGGPDKEDPEDKDQLRRAPLLVLSPSALIIVALLTGLLLGGSWLVGYTLSEQRAPESLRIDTPENSADLDEEGTHRERANDTRKARDVKGQEKREGRRKSKRGPLVASGGPDASGGVMPNQNPAPVDVASAPDNSSSQPAPQEPARQAPAKKKPQPPSYPPAPTRYLYHLVNPQTNDHFVTTESATASEYQAMGYEGGAIARVYSYQEENTKAVSTNQGTAYIFISASPKTEPASSTIPLWYSANGNGDFFYTTNESEAKRSGWQGSLIGYGRSL